MNNLTVIAEQKSVFGKGFVYCLGLFLKHDNLKKENELRYWFDGAKDHILECEVPQNAPQKIKDLFYLLGETIREYNFFYAYTLELDYKTGKNKCIELVEEILFEYDKFLGNNPQKAEWR